MLILLTLVACKPATPPADEVEESAEELVQAREVEDDNPGNEARPLDALIRIKAPGLNGLMGSPFTVRGEAVGGWFFEGSFPMALTDDNGKILAEGIATAEGDWMVADFVPFSVELNFTAPSGTKAWLEFIKDNPSGEEELDRGMRYPVIIE